MPATPSAAMTTTDFAAAAAVVIALIALGVSFLSLWHGSLSPFRLVVLNSAPHFSLYQIDREEPENYPDQPSRWWIPSFDLGVSFHNTGRRAGQVLDLRLWCQIRWESTRHEYFFTPQWVVDYGTFDRLRHNRFGWLAEAVRREWYPLLLQGHAEQSLHLVLERGGPAWDKPFKGRMDLWLQLRDTSKPGQWLMLHNYELVLTEDMFGDSSTWMATEREVKKPYHVRMAPVRLP